VIVISDHSDFPVASLKKFLGAGSKRYLPLRQRLEQNIMELSNYGKVGRSYNFKKSIECRNPGRTFQPHMSWQPPIWSSNIIYEKSVDLFELAAARDVAVDGRICEAIRIQQFYSRHLDVITAAKTK